MIADLRTLGRDVRVFCPTEASRKPFMFMAFAFVHFHLRHLRLMNAITESASWIGDEKVQVMAANSNVADAALRDMADQLEYLSKNDGIKGFGLLRLSQTLASLSLAQAGCERIANTPLPFIYSLLVRRTT